MIAHNGNLTDRDWDSFYQVDRSESPELRVDPEDRGKGGFGRRGERNTLLLKVDRVQTFEA